MNPQNDTQVAEEAVVQILRATRIVEAEAPGPTRHSQQTDQCPNIARFTAVYCAGARWLPEESAHVATCPFCQKVLDMFATAVSKIAQASTVSDAVAKSEEETFRNIDLKKPGTGDEPKPG